MSEHLRRLHPEKQLSEQSFYLWRAIQAAVWLVGAGIMICLVFFPNIGLLLFFLHDLVIYRNYNILVKSQGHI